MYKKYLILAIYAASASASALQNQINTIKGDIKASNELNGQRFKEVNEKLRDSTHINKTRQETKNGVVSTVGYKQPVTEAVTALEKSVTTINGNIKASNELNEQRFKQLERTSKIRMDRIEKTIKNNHKEMKSAAAQSAALTGLFQPYSVGALNFTAALGGYDDQQATAVGFGYRFTNNVAAKAGVGTAFNYNNISWNIGVNFEF